jgi:hypothetical protein
MQTDGNVCSRDRERVVPASRGQAAPLPGRLATICHRRSLGGGVLRFAANVVQCPNYRHFPSRWRSAARSDPSPVVRAGPARLRWRGLATKPHELRSPSAHGKSRVTIITRMCTMPTEQRNVFGRGGTSWSARSLCAPGRVRTALGIGRSLLAGVAGYIPGDVARSAAFVAPRGTRGRLAAWGESA